MYHIAACTDKRFVMPTGVMIHSLSKTHADILITFHVLTDESVGKKQQKMLKSTIVSKNHRLIFYPISYKKYSRDKRWKGGFTLPPAAYYRLSLAEVLPKEVNRVLYLDGDIAVNGRLDILFTLNLNSTPVMASSSYPPNIKSHTLRLGYDCTFGYFNSGVLLINLKWWREHNAISIFEHIMVNKADQIMLHDQDVLNMAFAEKKQLLPIQFNAQPWLFLKTEYDLAEENTKCGSIDDARSNPIIIHYCGRAKPWHTDCQHPLRDIFLKNMSETPWKDQKLYKSWKDGSLRDKFYHIIGNIKNKLRLK